MEKVDKQTLLLDTINEIVEHKISFATGTQTVVGVVISDPSGYECKVKIGMDELSCTLPEHLHTWIQKDDVVTVQDFRGDGMSLMVTGKTGSIHKSPSIVFNDEKTNKLVSGVDGAFEGDDKLDGHLTVEGEY